MKEENILDIDEIPVETTELYPLFWWEKNRIWYNTILISFQVFLFFIYWNSILRYGLWDGILEATMFTVVFKYLNKNNHVF